MMTRAPICRLMGATGFRDPQVSERTVFRYLTAARAQQGGVARFRTIGCRLPYSFGERCPAATTFNLVFAHRAR
jgi:hypothetical protein